jgi:hypothetical protein
MTKKYGVRLSAEDDVTVTLELTDEEVSGIRKLVQAVKEEHAWPRNYEYLAPTIEIEEQE